MKSVLFFPKFCGFLFLVKYNFINQKAYLINLHNLAAIFFKV